MSNFAEKIVVRRYYDESERMYTYALTVRMPEYKVSKEILDAIEDPLIIEDHITATMLDELVRRVMTAKNSGKLIRVVHRD